MKALDSQRRSSSRRRRPSRRSEERCQPRLSLVLSVCRLPTVQPVPSSEPEADDPRSLPFVGPDAFDVFGTDREYPMSASNDPSRPPRNATSPLSTRASSKRWLLLLLAVLTALAWHNRFVQDDAFISFRYSENLSRGEGLVWNEGERVEGYTNFLWTVIMAMPIGLEQDPVLWTYVIGLFLFATSLALTWQLALETIGRESVALASVALVGTNFTFSSYATGGLETQLQTALVLACLVLAVHASSGRIDGWRCLLFSLLTSAAVLTRMDSVVLLAVPGLLLLYELFRKPLFARQKLWLLAVLATPFSGIVGTWVLWKYWYYGGLLPNTYYIKVGGVSGHDLFRGSVYIAQFFVSYLLFPVGLFYLLKVHRLGKDIGRSSFFLLNGALFLWLAYVIRVGGDFMEFRFLVPVLPLLFVLTSWLVLQQVASRQIRAGLLILILGGSVFHALTYTRSPLSRYMESVQELASHVPGWKELGLFLEQSFPDRDVTIAVTPAGIIPFYSRLPSVDMLGLSDRWVAENGLRTMGRSGHRVMAPIHYLVAREVHLVFGHPYARDESDLPDGPYDFHSDLGSMFLGEAIDSESLPPDAEVLLLPVNQNRSVVCIYLTKSEVVEDAIREQGWLRYPLVLRDGDSSHAGGS